MHAKQQLGAVSGAGGEVDDGLLVQHEAVVIERVADALRLAQTGPVGRVNAADVGLRDAVAPGLLGLIEGDVGEPEQLLGTGLPVGLDESQAGAYSEPDRLCVDIHGRMRPQRGQEVLGH